MFDTQIAHRILTEATLPDDQAANFKENSVGLNDLLKRYLNKENDCKDLIQSEMKSNKDFWNIRPLSVKMIEYAGQDVFYLPFLYEVVCHVFISYRNSPNCRCPEEVDIRRVFEEASKCNTYAYINKGKKSIRSGDVIQAFVKNFQQFGIFCSLNLGISGLIKHPQSHQYVQENHKFGDIITVKVARIAKERRAAEIEYYGIEDLISGDVNYNDEQYMEFYYDEYNNNDTTYLDEEYVVDEFGHEIPNYQQYYGTYNEGMQPPEYTLGYAQPPGYDMVGYYTPPDMGYSNFQTEQSNSQMSTCKFLKLFGAEST